MTLCSHRGEMGNIFTRTEAVETEFPGGIMATQVVNIARQSPHSTWIKTNQTAPHCQSEKQQANCLTSASSQMKEDTIKDTSSKQNSSAPSMKFTRDEKESPLERFVFRRCLISLYYVKFLLDKYNVSCRLRLHCHSI